jgi:uncharacterized membrane protein YgdD (TMEM256/DUF423 family)
VCRALTLAGILGATGVAAGAFGAHGLRAVVEPAQLDVWKTAAQYQLFHATALLALGLAAISSGHGALPVWLRRASYFWAGGVVLFSGSLYLLVLASLPFVGVITPIGGVSLMLGWLCVLMAARNPPSH